MNDSIFKMKIRVFWQELTFGAAIASFPCVLQDERLLRSTRLTERSQLWDKYANDVDQHTVKMDFLRKVHRVNPPFKVKVKHPRKMTMKVSERCDFSCQYDYVL